ncbi:hypothetical protein NQ315_000851 [Exocentrus adspersus]|uniref:Uncharacterized protein n=1 Tax=Exocentrus adspersus TaxID=1586481 RepID=A0AAV8WDC5_9CUCU|nr:hypothetical protein NQ315_000851 [Exocentrus adspersus]
MFSLELLICYTDGFFTRDDTQDQEQELENNGPEQSYSLGSYATDFQVEVFAVLMVAQRCKSYAEEKIFICSSCHAALRAVSSLRTRSILVQECGNALKFLSKQKAVGLV